MQFSLSNQSRTRAVLVVAAGFGATCAACGDAAAPAPVDPRETAGGAASDTVTRSHDALESTCPDYSPNKNLYWGDLHSHTSFSSDAYVAGTRNTPADAYMFARGAEKPIAEASGDGVTAKIDRPLDFLAVTDHSEWLAIAYGCGKSLDGTHYYPLSSYYSWPACDTFRNSLVTDEASFDTVLYNMAAGWSLFSPCLYGLCPPVKGAAWQEETRAADTANERCVFTALKAFEWSATRNNGSVVLHKNVIFGTDVVPTQVLDWYNYQTAPALWGRLDAVCMPPACEALTIPHNSNQSRGYAFEIPGVGDAEIDHMAKYQRLVEVHQHKGDSECMPEQGNDPKCDFEHLGPDIKNEDPELPQSFVRYGLGQGLSKQPSTTQKKNPFRFGMVGSTDDHDGTPGNVAENTFPGHAGAYDDSPRRRLGNPRNPKYNPGGLTGVWATQNTRAAIFEALKNREVYATSGPRIGVRFYQVWSDADFCTGPNAANFPQNVIAANGVPMGQAMHPGGAGQTPTFIVSFVWDGTNIAEIDLVKGSYADGRMKPGKVTPKTPPNPVISCVQFKDAEYSPTENAYYYARVLQVSTPRWSHRDCVELLGEDCDCQNILKKDCNQAGPTPFCPDLQKNCMNGTLSFPINIQERAWTSPIWSHDDGAL